MFELIPYAECETAREHAKVQDNQLKNGQCSGNRLILMNREHEETSNLHHQHAGEHDFNKLFHF